MSSLAVTVPLETVECRWVSTGGDRRGFERESDVEWKTAWSNPAWRRTLFLDMVQGRMDNEVEAQDG
jgi:hypothetical protein